MLSNLIKKLSQRSQNIIGAILSILIITAIASMLACIIFAVIGKLSKLSFMTSLAGFCFLIFRVIAVILAPVIIIILTSFIIDAFIRDGFKKLLIRILKNFTVAFILIMFFNFIKYKNLEWIKSILYAMMITLLLFSKTEVDLFIEEKEKEQSSSALSNEEFKTTQ